MADVCAPRKRPSIDMAKQTSSYTFSDTLDRAFLTFIAAFIMLLLIAWIIVFIWVLDHSETFLWVLVENLRFVVRIVSYQKHRAVVVWLRYLSRMNVMGVVSLLHCVGLIVKIICNFIRKLERLWVYLVSIWVVLSVTTFRNARPYVLLLIRDAFKECIGLMRVDRLAIRF